MGSFTIAYKLILFYIFAYSDRLMSFLDDIGALKLIDLLKIDYSSKEAVCFFCNIYHALLLHARLVLGSPNEEVKVCTTRFIYV